MKPLITTLAFALLTSFAEAQPQSVVEIKNFSDLPTLRSWAVEKPFGGGSLEILSHGNQEIALANRLFTSGVESSEVTVFVRSSSGGWDQALVLGRYHSDSVKFKQDGDAVVLFLARSGQELVRFSIQGLREQFHQPATR